MKINQFWRCLLTETRDREFEIHSTAVKERLSRISSQASTELEIWKARASLVSEEWKCKGELLSRTESRDDRMRRRHRTAKQSQRQRVLVYEYKSTSVNRGSPPRRVQGVQAEICRSTYLIEPRAAMALAAVIVSTHRVSSPGPACHWVFSRRALHVAATAVRRRTDRWTKSSPAAR